jgi:iron complex outermembrane receptor protein
MKSRILYVAAITFALLLPGGSFCSAADFSDIDLNMTTVGDELLLFQDIPSVFSASKYEQKITEAPSSVSIVTAEEIKRYGYRTLADLLRGLRGFYITSDRVNQYQGVRGFNRPGDSNSRFLLLVDGLRLNDSIFGAAYIDTFFIIDVDLIDRVEVIRGPSSSLYGTNAFFGVINVITKRGRDLQSLEVSGDGGTHDTYKGRLSYGNRYGTGLEMLLSATKYESEGDDRLYYPEFDTIDTNHGVARNGDDDEVYRFFGKFAFGDFTLEGAYVDREKRFPTAAYGTEFNDPRNRVISEQGVGQLVYEHHFADHFDLLARGSYNYYSSDGNYVYDYSPTPDPFIVINKDEFRGAWWGGEIQATKRLQKHTLIFGGEYQNHYRQDQKNFDLAVYLDEQHDSENWGVYIQDEYQIFDALILNAGVRHDEYSTFGSTTNPRLALIYSPLEKTTLKFLYGEAFRAPNAFEFFYHDGLETQKPNPDLEPERITTYELVLEQYLGSHLHGIINGFYYETEDLINLMLDPDDGLLVFDNVDEVEAMGVELELEGKWNSGFEGRASYSFQEAKNRKTDQLLTNSPKHLAKLNLIVPLYKDKFLLGIEEQYMGKRKTRTGDEAGGFAVTNLTLFSQHMAEGLEFSASVYNLFDKKFSDPASAAHRQDTIEQDGQILRLKITYIF